MAIQLEEHPIVIHYRERESKREAPISTWSETQEVDASWLRQLILDAGADDAGFVEIDRPELDEQREEILSLFPATKTVISLVVRMNREPVRSPARSVANLEFHKTGEKTDEIARHVVRALQDQGIRALNPAMAFPMEMNHYPGKAWLVSHKPIAEAAGLGVMGIHRNVIHPKDWELNKTEKFPLTRTGDIVPLRKKLIKENRHVFFKFISGFALGLK
ncbi:MAG: hypothetical protein AAF702_41470, partial [Chloroflexota bacterium]